MALFSDYYDRATKVRSDEVAGQTVSAKAREAALVVEKYFADKMSLLPEDVRPKHPVMTPKDAAPYVRHFLTTDLVEHLGKGPMKRAVAAAVRTTPTLADRVTEMQRRAREEEINAIAEARKVLPGKIAQPYEGQQTKRDERKVLTALGGNKSVIAQYPALARMYRRDPSILHEHFQNAARIQRQDPTKIAQQILANRQKRALDQELTA